MWRKERKMREMSMELPTCDVCGGTGYIYGKVSYYGMEYETVDECQCMKNRRAASRWTGLSDKEMTFDSYEDFEPWQKTVKKKAMEYADDPTGWFAIVGASGAGKTHICTAIAKEIAKREPLLYIKNDVLRKMKFDTDEEELEKYKTIPYLHIDDFLKGNTSDAELKIAYEIINERYFRDLPTIISSERTLKEMMLIDIAIAGRIKEKAQTNLLDLGNSESRNYRLGGKK